MAISLGGFSGGGGGGAVDSVNGQTGVVVVSGNDLAADHSASNYTAANANIDGHLSGIDTKLGTLATGLTYQGAFNATTGAPSIANASQGDLYVISVAGTIYGQTWAVGDHLLINADMGGSVDNAKVDKIDNTDQVTSVNTQTGAVVLSGNDLAADHSASNYTAANANIDGHLSGIDTKFGTLGTASTAASTSFLQVVNNLGDITSATTARGHLGLGSAALEDVGITANDLVQLDGTAKLPAIDGSQLTNLPSAPVTSVNTLTGAVVVSGDDIAADHSASNYTAANANIDGHLSGIDTKFGTLGTASTSASTSFLQVVNNLGDITSATTARGHLGLGTAALEYVGTTANDLVQLDGTAKLPAVDGSQLTNLPSAPVTSVNTLTGVVVVSGDDIAADHSASNYTAANANIDGHLSGIDTKLGSLVTGMTYQGGYDATNNTPSLANTSKGDFYIITTGGTRFGRDWSVGDHLVINEDMGAVVSNGKIDKIDNTDAVASVNGLTGVVVVSGDDIAADHSASNYTAANANIDGHLSGIDTKFGTLGTASTAASTAFLSATGPDALGGNINVNGHDIVSVSNGDIEVDPDGTGSFKIRGNATSGSGRLVLNCQNNSHGITLKGPPHSAAANYTLTFPDTDGTADQVLKTDGSGGLDWVDQASGGGGWTYSAITADPANAQASYHYSCTGTFTITLPTSGVSAGEEIRVKNMGTGTITIDPQTRTIDGDPADYVLDVEFSAITLVSTGTNWEII